MAGKLSVDSPILSNTRMNPFTDAATFVDILRWRSRHQAASTAFTFLQDGEPSSMSYGELDRSARAIAAELRTLEPRVKQALPVYPAGMEFIAAFWGCLYAGVTAVPIHPPRLNQSLERFHAVAVDSEAAVALTTSGQVRSLEGRARHVYPNLALRWLAVDQASSLLHDRWEHPGGSRDTLALLQYTSGSTGSPKGVMVSHGNLIHNSEFLRRCFELSEESVSVCWLPNFHDMALVDGILQPMYTGYPGVILSPVSFLQSPIRWLEAITQYRGTHCGGPNFAYDLCVRKITREQRETLDLSCWLTAYNGAEPVHRHTLERFTEWFESCGFKARFFYPCYGMAESTLIVSGGSVADDPVYFIADADALEDHRVAEAGSDSTRVRHLVGCGHAWLDTRIVIADPVSAGLCGAGQIGEIWISGGSVAHGYWNRPELSAETFGARLADTGEGPYLRTGDLGFIRNGELFVTGRIKDMIIIRGQNYYPQDIERTVQDSYPGLRQSCGAAFSVEVENQEQLIVVQEVERTHLRHLNAKAAVKAIREAVANEHGRRVAEVVFIKPANIPKTSSGKIQRQACRKKYLDGTLETAGAFTTQIGSAGVETGS
jgi:acyl-CoA synthetase (AMP-forming)/AMP-acid ligase II